jgi:nitroreductase
MRFEDLIAMRKSTRTYSGEPIPEERIEQLLAAAHQAPSSRNLHPVDYIVVRDHALLRQLSRVKTAGSGMLKNADVGIVVLGDREKSDAWIEDCSIAMIYMQLMATELGIGNCWVQCRGRKSQQKKGQPIPMEEDQSPAETEAQVAARIAAVRDSDDYLTSEEFARELLHFPAGLRLETS